MGGHSHWSTIKRHKAGVDAKRGKLFTKLLRELTVAARAGGDPDANPSLRTAVVKAKDANMPAETIKRAIQRGTGELPGTHYEELTLEGYGPGGTGLLIEIMTDNRNRTVAEIRSMLGKHHGTMAEAGAVAWQFDKKGVFLVKGDAVEEDQLLGIALEAGADDVKKSGAGFELTTAVSAFDVVRTALQRSNVDASFAEITYLPQSHVRLDEKPAEQMLKLMEILDDHDDVQKVHANFDIPDDVMEKVAGSG